MAKIQIAERGVRVAAVVNIASPVSFDSGIDVEGVVLCQAEGNGARVDEAAEGVGFAVGRTVALAYVCFPIFAVLWVHLPFVDAEVLILFDGLQNAYTFAECWVFDELQCWEF